MNKSKSFVATGALSFSHTVIDIYGNYIPALLPFLVISLGINATKAALLVSVFSLLSSFSQPVFGYFVDKQGMRWLVYLGTLWLALLMSLTGLIASFSLLLFVVALAGLGTAAFHPQASAMVNVIGGKKAAVVMSFFLACGNMGYAISLLVLPPIFEEFGLHSTIFTVIPGLIAVLLLFFFAPKAEARQENSATFGEVLRSLRASSREMILLIVIITIRTLVYFGLLTIFPLYFSTKTLSIPWNYLMFIMLFCGVIGGIAGGYLANYWGNKKVIAVSLLLTTPMFLGFLFTSGLLSTIFLALAGVCLLASFPVTVVATQDAIPQNKSLAAGISMGLTGGLASLALVPVGVMGDTLGLTSAIYLLFLLPAGTGILALFLKSRPGDDHGQELGPEKYA